MDAWKTSGSSPGLGRKPLNPPQTPVPLKTQPQVDFSVENHGSIFLLRPITPAAFTWVSEHISDDAQYFGNAVCVEHRYVEDIVDGIEGDGLEVA